MKQINELAWIAEAKRHIGLKEIVGKKHNPVILAWIKELGGWFRDDETPWCGTFVAHCLQSAGVTYPKHWYRALAYADRAYGTPLDRPAYGCVAVKKRQGGGHVCFIVGRDEKTGKLLCLGGNQSNSVNIALYDEDVFSFWWYGRYDKPLDSRYDLPMLAGVGRSSGREA